jgi:hypothetical protein
MEGLFLLDGDLAQVETVGTHVVWMKTLESYGPGFDKLRNACKRVASKIRSFVSMDKLFSLDTDLTQVIDLTPSPEAGAG